MRNFVSACLVCHTWLGHETMVCPVCLAKFLWIRDMARLLRGTFVSWWYLPRIWPSVTDMQHYYHARYPTDDWHLAYMFSLVYFSVDVCTGGERTRVSADTLVKMAEDSFIASASYRQIYRHCAFIGDPYLLRLLSLVWGTLRRSFKSW